MTDSGGLTGRPSLFVLGSFVVACSAKVERFPSIGESATAEHFIVEAGGKGFNLATAAHRLGATVHSIFAIGNDLFAETAAPAFAKAGFTPTRLVRCAGRTGSGIGFIDATGETCVAVYSGANLSLSGEDVQAVAASIAGSRVVLAQFEIADAPIAAAFAKAREHGAQTMLNPSPFRMPSPEILRDTTMLVVNEVEAQAIVAPASLDDDKTARAAIEAVLACGPDMLVVTRGPRGAVAHRRDAPALIQPAFAIEAVDSLGAGDAFLASLAVGLAEERTLEDSLRRAAAAGAIATARPGVFDALATLDALEQFLAERHGEAHSFSDL